MLVFKELISCLFFLMAEKTRTLLYFLPRMKIKNYNIEVDGRNYYDQAMKDTIKQYDEVRKISIGQGDDYKNGCLLDLA